MRFAGLRLSAMFFASFFQERSVLLLLCVVVVKTTSHYHDVVKILKREFFYRCRRRRGRRDIERLVGSMRFALSVGSTCFTALAGWEWFGAINLSASVVGLSDLG
jgi:hypothetical protein